MKVKLHEQLTLHKSRNKIYIEPVGTGTEALTIDCRTCQITVNKQFSYSLLPTNVPSMRIYGIVGIKRLPVCPYLIVITQISEVSVIDQNQIYAIDGIELIPFSDDIENHEQSQYEWNCHYKSMIKDLFKTPQYYFSYTYDLTNSMQRSYLSLHGEKSSDISFNLSFGTYKSQHSYDTKFLWNLSVLSDFFASADNCDSYILPIIHGFVKTIRCTATYSHFLYWTLISRRSNRRAGTRFLRRGLDADGNAANYVETEQVVEFDKYISSFVIIRGSIPLVWYNRRNYRYRPPTEIDQFANQEATMRKHFDQLLETYKKVSVVNLVDQKGAEGMLENEFRNTLKPIQAESPIIYHYFDFHKECSNLRWFNLNKLIRRLEPEIKDYQFFAISKKSTLIDGELLHRQTGVFRVNCIDSLDRTNVLQSMIAYKIVESQVEGCKITPLPVPIVLSCPSIDTSFKHVWSDNADHLSIQYAGTPALKTDFTRFGHRTKLGIAKDGWNSITRYFLNNFYDDYRQDSLDLFHGNFAGYPSPLYKPWFSPQVYNSLPITLVVIILIILYFFVRY